MKLPNAWRPAAALCAVFTSSGASAEPAGGPINITNSKPGTFEVVSHRMDPVGIGAASGGLVGAAIQSGIESSEDGGMKKELLQVFPDASCAQPLLDAFTSHLRTDGTFSVGDAPSKKGAIVDIAIDECGFHLADTTAKQYSSYVYLTIKVKPMVATAWSEKIQVSGRNRYAFGDLLSQPGLAKSELADALTRAGTRAADKMIYKK